MERFFIDVIIFIIIVVCVARENKLLTQIGFMEKRIKALETESLRLENIARRTKTQGGI